VSIQTTSRRPIAVVCLGTIRPHVDVHRMTHLMLLMSGRRFLACLGISRRRIVSFLAPSDSFVDDCVSWNDRTRTMGVCAFVLICMYNSGSSGGKRGEMNGEKCVVALPKQTIINLIGKGKFQNVRGKTAFFAPECYLPLPNRTAGSAPASVLNATDLALSP